MDSPHELDAVFGLHVLHRGILVVQLCLDVVDFIDVITPFPCNLLPSFDVAVEHIDDCLSIFLLDLNSFLTDHSNLITIAGRAKQCNYLRCRLKFNLWYL